MKSDRFGILENFAAIIQLLSFMAPVVSIAVTVLWAVHGEITVENFDGIRALIIIVAVIIAAGIFFVVFGLLAEICQWLVDVGEDIRRSADAASKTHEIVSGQDAAWKKANPESAPRSSMPSTI